MKNKLYMKTVWRDIRDSFGRFAAIVIIIFMSVLLFVGIKSIGPDLNHTADEMITQQKVSDIQVVSTAGLSENDLKEVEALGHVKGELGQRLAIHEAEKQLNLQVYSYQGQNSQNQPLVTDGRMPEKSDEILLDRMLASTYPIGTELTLENDQLKESSFTVVGYGDSPIYVDDRERGVTNVGDGQVAGFAYVPLAAFEQETYSILYVSFTNLTKYAPTSDDYKTLLTKQEDRLTAVLDERRPARLEELKDLAYEKLSPEEKKVADGIKEIEEGQQKLDDTKAELASGKEELATNQQTLTENQAKLTASQAELAEKETQLVASRKELEANKQTLAAKEAELTSGKAELEAQQQTLTEKQQQLAEKRQELESSKQLLADKEAELQAGQAELASGREQLAAGKRALAAKRQALTDKQAELASQQEAVTAAKAQLDQQQAALDQQRSQLEATVGKEEADKQLAEAEAQLATALSQWQQGSDQLQAAQTQLQAGQEQLRAGEAELAAQETQLSKAEAAATAGAEQLARSKEQLASGEEQLAAGETQLADGQAQLDAAKQELADGEAQLQSAKEQLADGEAQLVDGETQLADGKSQLEAGLQELAAGQRQLDEASEQLEAGEKELAEKQAELTKNREKLMEGQVELEDAKGEIETLEQPNYLLTQRQDNPGFNEFQSLAVRIDAIANVFPVFFFLIAILIIFTSMTRMIEEHRREIGTLKALGYRNGEIAAKYMLYAFIATFIGSVLGFIVGTHVLPRVVFSMLQEQYIYPEYAIDYWFVPILIAVVAAAFSTLFSSGLVLLRDLREKPTALLNARAPKSGQRVLLERIPAVWNHLNFNQKVAYRNIFRYKARGLLTIFGIAGCTGLMIAGFGLKDSIPAPTEVQFNQLVHYDGIVSLEDLNDQKLAEMDQLLAKQTEVTETLPLVTEQVTFKNENTTKQTATLNLVAPDSQEFTDFVTLRDLDGDTLALPEEGAMISRQLAKLFKVDQGDTLTMTDSQGEAYEIEVAGVFDNYLGHTLYLAPAYYQELTGNTVKQNAYWIRAKKSEASANKELVQTLYDSGNVLNVTFMSDQLKKQDSMTESIGPIVFVFILLSAVLAFVVLYNLTNINISERQREMATIKVLGFFDNEVTMYLLRETVAFTLVGIPLGFVIGRLLTWFILTMASSETILFPVTIHWQGYLVSAILTVIFTGIVSVVTHFKLKGIHMIEALKSNE